jgi:hypothetical protein
MKTPRLLALVLLVSSFACTSCKTAGTPDGGGTPSPVSTFVGIVADCGTTLGGPIAGAEIPKIVTAFSGDPLNFGAVDAAVDGVIADLTNKGFLVSEAINFVACVAEGELGRAERDARLDDAIAARRVTNVRSWFAAHQVTFAPSTAARGGAGGH